MSIEELSHKVDEYTSGPFSIIDVLFLDGDHSYEGVLKDVVSWFPHVAYGGKMLFDDYNDKTGVRKAIDLTIKYHREYPFSVDQEMYLCEKKVYPV
jgi:hypothetical protein